MYYLGEKKEYFHVRFGRPRQFIVDSSPSCFTILVTQSSLLKCRPRCALKRRPSNLDLLSDPFTNSIQSLGHSIGHSFRNSDLFPSARTNRDKLDPKRGSELLRPLWLRMMADVLIFRRAKPYLAGVDSLVPSSSDLSHRPLDLRLCQLRHAAPCSYRREPCQACFHRA